MTTRIKHLAKSLLPKEQVQMEELEQIDQLFAHEAFEQDVAQRESLEATAVALEAIAADYLAQVSPSTASAYEFANKINASLESHEELGQLSATAVSMESIGETLLKIWKAIKALVEKAWHLFTEFFRNLFSNVVKVARRAGQIIDRAEALKTAKVPKTHVVNRSLVASLAVGDEIGYDVVRFSTGITTELADLAHKDLTNAEFLLEHMEQLLRRQQLDAAMLDMLVKTNFNTPISFKKEVEDDRSIISSRVLPGNKVIEIIVPNFKDLNPVFASDPRKVASLFNTGVGHQKTSIKRVDQDMDKLKTEYPVLAINEIIDICKGVETSCDLISNVDYEIKKLMRRTNSILEDEMRVVLTINEALGDPGSVVRMAIARALSRVAQNALRPSAMVFQYSAGLSRDFLRYAEASLDQYEAKAA